MRRAAMWFASLAFVAWASGPSPSSPAHTVRYEVTGRGHPMVLVNEGGEVAVRMEAARLPWRRSSSATGRVALWAVPDASGDVWCRVKVDGMLVGQSHTWARPGHVAELCLVETVA